MPRTLYAHRSNRGRTPQVENTMNTTALARTPSRALPLAALVFAAGLLVVAPQVRKASQQMAPANTDTAPAVYVPNGANTLLPYGAVGHDVHAAPQTVLPYGAVSHEAMSSAETVLPYGAMTSASLRDAITPYGLLSRHAAP